ncbi:hypothetical protein ACWDG1_39795 [Streptomyces sp. NPDC001177]
MANASHHTDHRLLRLPGEAEQPMVGVVAQTTQCLVRNAETRAA